MASRAWFVTPGSVLTLGFAVIWSVPRLVKGQPSENIGYLTTGARNGNEKGRHIAAVYVILVFHQCIYNEPELTHQAQHILMLPFISSHEYDNMRVSLIELSLCG